jgi:hypothetical protein
MLFGYGTKHLETPLMYVTNLAHFESFNDLSFSICTAFLPQRLRTIVRIDEDVKQLREKMQAEHKKIAAS